MFSLYTDRMPDRSVDFRDRSFEKEAPESHHILVADSDSNILDQLTRSIGICAKHCRILTAKDGGEAVGMLRSFRVDSLLTDYNMSVVDGYSIIDYARFYHPDVKVYVMSEGDPYEIQRRLRNSGVSGFVTKPYRIETIYSVLRV